MTLVRKLGWGSLVAALFLLPYYQYPWWQYFHTTYVWVLLWIARFGRQGLERLGLALPRVDLALVPLAAAIVIPAAMFLQQWAAPLERAWLAFPENVDPLFQALNEEILLGWLLLSFASRWIRSPWLLCWSVALAFALLHLAFYLSSSSYGQFLSPAALLSLLMVGVTRNALILWRGHIGYAWALHGGWNLGFFGCHWRHSDSKEFLGEPELFDLFLGHPAMLVAAAVLAMVGTALVRRGAHPAFTRRTS